MFRSLVALSAASLIGGANAFWRMECPGRVGLARLDPIMNPGTLSPHMHTIHGSSGLTESSLTAELLAGDCTSCRVTQDKSAYWHPALYFQDASTGEFELVTQVGGMLAYYLLNGENITAFPTGFRMMSGDTTRRTYTAGDPSQPDPEKSIWALTGETDQGTLAQRALGFNCLNYAKDPEATLYRHYLPDKAYLDANCANGIRFEAMFPSCWNGEALDSDNHKDHVAFPDLVMTGNCPESHPIRLPSLLYETIWDTASFQGRGGQFVIANGDVSGYGYHADFIMGWDEAFLQQAVETCTNPSGRIEDCPIFDVVDEATAKSCEIAALPEALSKEVGEGPLASLPGGVQITYADGAPDGAPEEVEAPEPSAAPAAPSLSYAPGQIPEDPASPVPGDVFKEAQTTAPYVEAMPTITSTTLSTSIVSTSTEAPVVEAPPTVPPPPPEPTTTAPPPPPAAPEEENASYWSTQYVTNGNVVSKILWQQEVVYVTEMIEATTTVVIEAAPTARRRRRGVHMHGHGHHHH